MLRLRKQSDKAHSLKVPSLIDRNESEKSSELIFPEHISIKRKDANQKTKVNDIDEIEVVRDLEYNSSMIFIVYTCTFFLNILINLDHGAIPAALINIQKDLKINNTEMGALGSLVFAGIVFGSATAAILFNRIQYKTLIIISLAVNGIALWMTATSSSYGYVCFSRFLAGFSQVFIIVYIPIYTDTYASKSQKQYMMSLSLIAPPLGVVLGYILTSYIVNSEKSTW